MGWVFVMVERVGEYEEKMKHYYGIGSQLVCWLLPLYERKVSECQNRG